MATTLANTCATEYGFIDEEFVETICQVLEIKPQHLIKLKQIQGFDGRDARPITHAIYPTPTVYLYWKSCSLVDNNIGKSSNDFWPTLHKKAWGYYWYDKQLFSFLARLLHIHRSYFP